MLRALFQALHEWVRHGRPPPASQVPTISRGTLQPVSTLQFPLWDGLQLARHCNDVVPPGDWIHPEPPGFRYGVRVCAVDADGNEVNGVLTPQISVPVGTYTGWNCYRAPYPQGALGDRRGSFIAFAATRGERSSNGDPRSSLRERYPSREAYIDLVRKAAAKLVKERFLLQADAQRYVAQAQVWCQAL